ncbi:MAG: hypothetical protein E7214_03955 [Clostridium sp.]|nr:hypothetical protein [Clostridium sp.]
MEEGSKKSIRWECTNWFVREDGLIQIYTQSGGKILLNEKLGQVWVNINYEITEEDLWNKVDKSIVSREEFDNAVCEFEKYGLISILEESDEFDSLFN